MKLPERIMELALEESKLQAIPIECIDTIKKEHWYDDDIKLIKSICIFKFTRQWSKIRSNVLDWNYKSLENWKENYNKDDDDEFWYPKRLLALANQESKLQWWFSYYHTLITYYKLIEKKDKLINKPFFQPLAWMFDITKTRQGPNIRIEVIKNKNHFPLMKYLAENSIDISEEELNNIYEPFDDEPSEEERTTKDRRKFKFEFKLW